MIQKKICMLGTFATGKTSLVARFVHNLFSEKYQTTVGVKVDKKVVHDGDDDVMLVVWDFAGADDLQDARPSLLRGAAGCLLVIDGSRPGTLDAAVQIRAAAESTIGKVPFVIALNKADLRSGKKWRLADGDLAALRARGWSMVETSALTGAGVDEAFALLAHQIHRAANRAAPSEGRP
jgi:small GTP-binding protein